MFLVSTWALLHNGLAPCASSPSGWALLYRDYKRLINRSDGGTKNSSVWNCFYSNAFIFYFIFLSPFILPFYLSFVLVQLCKPHNESCVSAYVSMKWCVHFNAVEPVKEEFRLLFVTELWTYSSLFCRSSLTGLPENINSIYTFPCCNGVGDILPPMWHYLMWHATSTVFLFRAISD